MVEISGHVTLKGKITIIKSLALAKLLYVTNIVWSTSWFTDEVTKRINSFLWNEKPPRTQNKIIIQEGGLRHIDYITFVKTQKIIWVKDCYK